MYICIHIAISLHNLSLRPDGCRPPQRWTAPWRRATTRTDATPRELRRFLEVFHGKTWDFHGKNMEKTWKKHGKNGVFMGKTWKNMEQMGFSWKNMENTWQKWGFDGGFNGIYRKKPNTCLWWETKKMEGWNGANSRVFFRWIHKPLW